MPDAQPLSVPVQVPGAADSLCSSGAEVHRTSEESQAVLQAGQLLLRREVCGRAVWVPVSAFAAVLWKVLHSTGIRISATPGDGKSGVYAQGGLGGGLHSARGIVFK